MLADMSETLTVLVYYHFAGSFQTLSCIKYCYVRRFVVIEIFYKINLQNYFTEVWKSGTEKGVNVSNFSKCV